MNLRLKKILIIISTAVPAVMITCGGVAKLAAAHGPVQMLSKFGVGPYIPLLGIAEIILTALFLIPQTRRLGFILLCCYFGGAIATVVSHQGSFFCLALIPLLVIWINMFLRDSALFLAAKKEQTFSPHA